MPQPRRSTAIPIQLKILAVLRFLAVGAFQKGASSDFNHPMSQASMCRCIDDVLNAILALEDNYIRFPQTREVRQNVSNG